MTTTSYWRKMAAPIIARVIKKHGTDDMKALRRALREAYPWGPKRMHPYRVWCDEIKRQLAPPPLFQPLLTAKRQPQPSPDQLSLLEAP